MKEFKLKFQNTDNKFSLDFGPVVEVSDGGFEKGYKKGYNEGLATRKYEIWTFTLDDGSIVEKKVPLI